MAVHDLLRQVIAGHSERRTGFGSEGESSDLVAEKAKVMPPSSHPCRATQPVGGMLTTRPRSALLSADVRFVTHSSLPRLCVRLFDGPVSLIEGVEMDRR